MKYICLYLHAHQPFRIKHFDIFNIGRNLNHFVEKNNIDLDNEEIFKKVASKSYYPMNEILIKNLSLHKDFKVNMSITGTLLEQMTKYDENLLSTFQALTKTKKCEILSETYYHSLASLFSKTDFIKQVQKHNKTIKKLFDQSPKFFRNTELIYSDYIANIVSEMGFKGIIAEGTEKILHHKSPNYRYKTNTKKKMHLMLKNYRLSDDIAFRFSNQGWKEYPLFTEKYLHWLDTAQGEVINLFMDYETFGEHQWKDTGIFDFFDNFVKEALNRGYKFINISEAEKKLKGKEIISSPFVISWADVERDTSAWTDNSMQRDSLRKLYELEKPILESHDKKLIKNWRFLQTSDHFYYMCTKWFNDGDVHKYFSPNKTPYEAYNNFNNALIDLEQNLIKHYNNQNLVNTTTINTANLV